MGAILLAPVTRGLPGPEKPTLWNGVDLKGWRVLPKDRQAPAAAPALASWTVREGNLHTTGKPTAALLTQASYENYRLKLEWRYAPTTLKRPNSGILIHAQPGDTFWPHSYEVQLAHGEAGDLWLQYDAQQKLPQITIDPARKDPNSKDRHYFRQGRTEAIEQPLGQWNRMEIVARGATLKVIVNDRLVNEATGCSLTRGAIGLQAEGAEIEFRRLELEGLQP
jgi:hypothetical protein